MGVAAEAREILLETRKGRSSSFTGRILSRTTSPRWVVAESEHGEPGYRAEETSKQGAEGATGFFLWRRQRDVRGGKINCETKGTRTL